MKNAIVKLGFCLLFFCASNSVLAGIPGVTVTRITSSPTNAASIEFDVLFTEDVSGFATGDATLSGAGAAGATGAIAAVGGSASHYKITVTGHTVNGPINVDIAAGVATATAAGNDPNTASTQVTTVFDNVKPGVTITHPGQADPTTGGSLAIKFTVEFTEDVTGFDASKMSFSGSGGGLGTLTFGTITEITTNRKWEVMVNVPVTATGNLDVLLSVPAGGVADAAGNTNNASSGGDNQVTYSGTFPTFATPTAVATHNSFTISSNILTSGGRTITERGTVWSTSTPVGASDHSNDEGAGTGTFDHVRSMSVTSHTKYYFATYAINAAVGKVLSAEGTVWTLDDPASADGNVTAAVASSGTTVNVTFTAFGGTADGLVIIVKPGASAVTSGEMLQGQDPSDQPYYFTTITSSSQTSVPVTGLTPGSTYTFSAIPFTVFGSQEETTNYRTGSFTSKTETTLVALSRIVENATPAATLDYASKQGTGTAITAASQGLSLADVKLVDGNAPANDSDNFPTELATLTIHVDNHQFIDHIAINDNGTIHAEGVLDASGDITFTIPAGTLIGADNDDDGDQFNIIANFKPTVTDGAVVKLTITGATTVAVSSGLMNASAGGYTTGNTRNAIAVIATTFDITGLTTPINPTPSTWGFTATLKDGLGNIDTNINGNLQISQAQLTGDLDNPIVSGVVSFSGLVFSNAGSKAVNLDATNWAGTNNGTLNVTVKSLGVIPVGPTGVAGNFCFNNADPDATATFQPLGNIVLPESDVTDFGVGAAQTFSLKLPDGFIFDTDVAPVLGKAAGNTDISIAAQVLAESFVGTNIVRVKYTVNATATLDVLTISGLKVKYTGITPVTNQKILRVGGSAIQEENDELKGNSHGELSSVNTATDLDFQNLGGYAAAQTSFSKVADIQVPLQGLKNAVGVGPAGVTFYGNGITLDGGSYKFNPPSVPIGSHPITFAYADPGNTYGCISTFTKNYSVFANAINGLNLKYCSYDPPSTLTSPSGFSAPFYYCIPVFPGIIQPAYMDPNAYVYRWRDAVNNVWVDLVDSDLGTAGFQFNPGSPLYTSSLNANGRILEVAVVYQNSCTGVYDGYGAVARVNIAPVPPIAFNTTFQYGVCSTEPAIALSGTLYDPDHGYDEMWASVVGNSGANVVGVTGSTTTGWTLTPSVANSTSTDKQIWINYKHRDEASQCIAEIHQVVDVWAKPAAVAASEVRNNGAPTISAQFCFKDSPTPYETTTVTNVFHKWTPLGTNARAPQEGDLFPLAKQDFNSLTAGEPNVNSVATYELRQIVHRQFGLRFVTFPVFGLETYTAFTGCESDPLTVNATIMQPTTVSFGPSITVCEGPPIQISSLGGTITSPDPGVTGIWSTEANSPLNFAPNNTKASALTYVPTQAEIDRRTVFMKLKTSDPVGPCRADSLVVKVNISPGVTIKFPGSYFDAGHDVIDRCAGDKISVETEISNNALAFTWTENGLGSIESGTQTSKITTYDLNVLEENVGGSVNLTVTTADPDDLGPGNNGPCTPATKFVEIKMSQRARVNAPDNFDVCANGGTLGFGLEAEIPLLQSSASGFTWFNVDGLGTLTDPTLSSARYETTVASENPAPSALRGDQTLTFRVESTPAGGANVCPSESAFVAVTIHNRPVVPGAANTTPTYCTNTPIGLDNALRVSPTDNAAVSWYSSLTIVPPATKPTAIGNDASFVPPVVTATGEQRVNFWASQTYDAKVGGFAGCESDYVPFTVIVNPIPVGIGGNPALAFTTAKPCLDEIMEFTNTVSLQGPIPGNSPRFISGYDWDFDDGSRTSLGTGPIPATLTSTFGTFENPLHKYTEARQYTVSLNVQTSDGCVASFSKSGVRVGRVPVASFTSKLICDQDVTEFVGDDGLAPPVVPELARTYSWDFNDAGATAATELATHKFTGVGTYDVTFSVVTDIGCDSTITKKVSILPFIKNNFPYIQDFENPNHGWVAEGNINGAISAQTSWSQLTSAGTITSDPGEGAGPTFWATHTDTHSTDVPVPYYYDNERSVLYGPCVDMRNLPRPVLSMDYFVDTEGKGDGAYVEYLDEELASPQWTRLGDNASGLNWYKEGSIGGLSPSGGVGQSLGQFGWTGNTKAWTTGRFNLDDFKDRKRLRFRIVFGSNISTVNTDTYDGFAMDYFKLETRNRLVLVENFTSKSSATVVTGNTAAYKAFPSVAASSEVVKIEYHTGLPAVLGDAEDPIFKQNPMDPNARAAFYGISAVPRGYIDGYTNLTGSGMFSGAWALPYYSSESLKTAPIDIIIEDPTTDGGIINIKGEIKAKDIALAANKYSLYIAVVEKEVGTDAFVLRKMLPSASGIKIPATPRGSTFEFDQSWSLDRAIFDQNSELVAVAFVQSDIITDQETKERAVLQAAFNDNIDAPSFFTTGVEVPFLERTAMYPNPADRLVTIELPQATDSGVEVRILDQLGRQVGQSSIGIGQRSTTIDTRDLAGTMYIVQLKERGVNTTKKLVITHRH